MPDLFSADACPRPFDPRKTKAGAGAHQCRVGGGNAMLSADHGRTWFCTVHAPPGFFPALKPAPPPVIRDVVF